MLWLIDANPETWEENRQIALEKATPNFSTHIKQALQLRNGTADRDDEKTIAASVIEAKLRGNSDMLVDFILDKPK